MKDEIHNYGMIETCFLKAKAYCYTTVKGEEEKKFKEITKANIEDEITIEDYKNDVFNNENKYATNHAPQKNKHRIRAKDQYKLALDAFDDKKVSEFRKVHMFLS